MYRVCIWDELMTVKIACMVVQCEDINVIGSLAIDVQFGHNSK